MAIASKTKRPSRSVHHQRRHGLHQKRNEHFIKTYWPYLPMLLVVVVGLAVNSLWATHTKPGVLAYASEMSTSSLLANTNAQRSANGEDALSLNAQLDQAAQAKANDMVARDYWSHNTPDGNPPWVFFTNAGYQFSAAGENLAYGFDTSDGTITGWMNSPEHRANILNSNFQDVGFGFANSANFVGSGPETVVVAEYGKPTAVAAAPVAPKPATPVPQAVAQPPAAAPSPAPATTPAPTPAPAVATTNPAPAASSTKTPAAVAKPTQAVAEPSSQKVARIQILTAGSAPWSMFVASTLASAGVLIFFIKHGLGLRRAFVYGETFIIKHKLMDFILITTTVAGFVLTRTSGFIR